MALRRLLVLALVIASAPALADEDFDVDFDVRIDNALRFNDNVYRLSTAQERRFDADSPANQTNGRFRGMADKGDWIWRPELAVDVELPGFGKKQEIHFEPWVGYDMAFLNSEQRAERAGVDARYELRGPQELRLDVSYVGKRLRKNYFYDSLPNPGPNVSTAERIYRPGRFRQAELRASYERRLWSHKPGKGSVAPRRLTGELGTELAWRLFNDAFENRDLDTRGGFGRLELEGRRWFAETEYAYLDREAPGRGENTLVDVGGSDVVQVVQVDRSRVDHRVRVGGGWKPVKRTWLELEYEWRRSDFGSRNPADTAYFRRTDTRQRVELEATYRWSKKLRLEAGLRWTDEETVTPLDPIDDEEEDDYRQWLARVGARVDF